MKADRVVDRPLERGIDWRPRHDSHFIVAAMLVSARDTPPICVQQRTLTDVETHLRRDGPERSFGLLTGNLCHCPRTRSRYVLVDGTIPGPPLEDGGDVHLQMALALGDRVLDAQRAGKAAVGFYRGGATVHPRAPATDVGLLRSLFTQPWQFMLLRDDRRLDGEGGLVRVEPTAMRAYAAPFVELLPRAARHRDGEPWPSAVSWSTYHASEPVTLLPELQHEPGSDAAVSPLTDSGAPRWSMSRIVSTWFRTGSERQRDRSAPATPRSVLDGPEADVVTDVSHVGSVMRDRAATSIVHDVGAESSASPPLPQQIASAPHERPSPPPRETTNPVVAPPTTPAGADTQTLTTVPRHEDRTVALAEPPRAEPPRAEPPRAEPPRAEPPRAEAPRAEPPRAEPPRAEAPRAEAPRAEPPRAEPPTPAIAFPYLLPPEDAPIATSRRLTMAIATLVALVALLALALVLSSR